MVSRECPDYLVDTRCGNLGKCGLDSLKSKWRRGSVWRALPVLGSCGARFFWFGGASRCEASILVWRVEGIIPVDEEGRLRAGKAARDFCKVPGFGENLSFIFMGIDGGMLALAGFGF